MSLPKPSSEAMDFFRQCLPEEKISPFLRKLTLLGEFLYEMNRQVNLTAIRETGFWSLHAADSLSVVRDFPELFQAGKRIADLGCGAGFPSLVLSSAFPELEFTSIDSTRKKIDFVNAAAEKLELFNLKGVHGRGNELGRKSPFKGSYDAVFARAVASADVLIREASGFLKPDGSLIVYRTPDQYHSELEYLKKRKAGMFRGTEPFPLPDQTGTRMFLQIKQMREMH